MAHEVLYGICESKCKVRIPRMELIETIFDSITVPANSSVVKSIVISTDLTNYSWAILPSYSATTVPSMVFVNAAINGRNIYIEFRNISGSSVTLSDVHLKLRLIENV